VVPEVLLFDLGNVLVEFSGIRDLKPLLRVPRSESEILQRWIACQTTKAFETGQITEAEFVERFTREWEVAVPPDSFLAAYRDWTRGFFPGAEALLNSLRGRFRLACLSNSNATHWARNEEIGILAHFDPALSSHRLGCHKPSAEIYERTISAVGVPADRIAFFDDSAANVRAATEVGMRAYQVVGFGELCRQLRALGILED
jgi:putative hydrolase of the HAD superfamily